MMASHEELAGRSDPHPQPDLIARHHGRDHIASQHAALGICDRERHRNCKRAGVQMRDDMNVVHFETVTGSRADKNGLSNPGANRCSDDAGARSPALLFDKGEDVLGPNLSDASEAATDRIEDTGLRLAYDIQRKLFVPKVRRESGKALGRTFAVNV